MIDIIFDESKSEYKARLIKYKFYNPFFINDCETVIKSVSYQKIIPNRTKITQI